MKKSIAITFLTALALLVIAAPAPAQFYPDPVDLGINNEQQEIEQWYWPALIRQVLLKRASQPPTQCQIASMAAAETAEEMDCCLNPAPEGCDRPLAPRQVLAIFERSGLQAQAAPCPKTAEQVYEHLINGRALMIGFFIAQDRKHAYLVRGISWTEDGQPMLLVNDPNVTEPFQAPFSEEYPGWQTAITVQMP